MAISSLQKSMGSRPLGWYCRYGPSVARGASSSRKAAFLYDSDAYNDDLPYYVQQDGKPHLVVPYTLTNNDMKFGTGHFGTGEDFYTYCRDAFDFLYEEGATQPKMMSIGMHMRLLGHPGRASGLARLLDHIKSRQDVWVCHRTAIARHWLERHPSAKPA